MNFLNQKKRIYSNIIASFLLAVALIAMMFPYGNVYAQASATYVVKLVDVSSLDAVKQVGDSVVQKFIFAKSPLFKNVYQFSSAKSLDQLRSFLGKRAVYVEQVKSFELKGLLLNDPGFTNSGTDVDKQWGLVKAGFLQAWDKTTGANTTVVAVIDTGIDGTHEDLKSINYVAGYNFLNDKPIAIGTNSDDNGHGTLVAGVLGATANNGMGIVGTNWDIGIMPLKALDAQGRGESTGVAEALVWAADHGANIVNMSLGGIGFGHDTTLSNAITYAFEKDVVLVAAAGNDVATTGGNLDKSPSYPICDDNNENMIIGVTATDFRDQKAGFANYGKVCIDVSAPGRRILSTINQDPGTSKSSPNSYAFASGTSLAVPFVSGEAALIKSFYPKATNAQVRDLIIATADPIDQLNPTECEGGPCNGMLGSGRINVQKALDTGIIIPATKEGDLIIIEGTSLVYHISGGQKRPVSSFVFNQRFQNYPLNSVPASVVSDIPEGPAETPLEGTLVKIDGNPAVYYMSQGKKLPVTYQIFQQRRFSFANVITVNPAEFNTWVSGNLLPPTEGTLLRGVSNRTVYWVVGGILHPINYTFYKERGLSVFPVMFVSDGDIAGFSKGEAYIK